MPSNDIHGMHTHVLSSISSSSTAHVQLSPILYAALCAKGNGMCKPCSVMSVSALQFAIYPLELIRTRLAVCPEGTYAGLTAAASNIWRTEGALSFYRGLLPSLVSG